MSEETSVLSLVKGFPRYLSLYFLGFLVVVISDSTITGLTLGSIAFGFAVRSVWAGLAVLFLLHTGVQVVNAITGAHIQHARIGAQPLRAIAAAFHNQGRPPITEPPSEA